jgi:hypothetical protein
MNKKYGTENFVVEKQGRNSIDGTIGEPKYQKQAELKSVFKHG